MIPLQLRDLPEVVYSEVKQGTLIPWFQINSSAPYDTQDQSTLNRNSFLVQALAGTSHFTLGNSSNIGP